MKMLCQLALILCGCLLLVDCDSSAQAVPTAMPGTIAASTTLPVPPTTTAPPAATAPRPAAFQVSAQPADTQVQLNWPAVAGASGYYVYRDGSATPLNATSLAERQYSDIGLTNGKSYTYQVAALDQAGLILAHSAALSATPKAP